MLDILKILVVAYVGTMLVLVFVAMLAGGIAFYAWIFKCIWEAIHGKRT